MCVCVCVCGGGGGGNHEMKIRPASTKIHPYSEIFQNLAELASSLHKNEMKACLVLYKWSKFQEAVLKTHKRLRTHTL